jgi:hypothetical protein
MKTYTIAETVRVSHGDIAYEYKPGTVKAADAAEVRVLEGLVRKGIAKRGASKPKE